MKKIEVRKSGKCEGEGLFACADFLPGEVIADWEAGGVIYFAERESDLPAPQSGYAIQIERDEFVDNQVLRNINHSCDPNCGIQGRGILVARKQIFHGDELFYDYAMTEDSDWDMPEQCLCGAPGCRKSIGGFRTLPSNVIEDYLRGPFVSRWLIDKYHLQ